MLQRMLEWLRPATMPEPGSIWIQRDSRTPYEVIDADAATKTVRCRLLGSVRTPGLPYVPQPAQLLGLREFHWLFKPRDPRGLRALQRLQLHPGDIIVLSLPGEVNDDVAAHWSQVLGRQFDGHRVVVLGHGQSLSAVGSPTWATRGEAVPDVVAASPERRNRQTAGESIGVPPRQP